MGENKMTFEEFWDKWHPAYMYGTGAKEWIELKEEMFEDLTKVFIERKGIVWRAGQS